VHWLVATKSLFSIFTTDRVNSLMSSGRRLPDWIRVKVQPGSAKGEVDAILKNLNLNTVCRSAHCPNLHECWQKRTATFMILGDKCSRNCKFCAVEHFDTFDLPDKNEPKSIAKAAELMKLKFAVVTSVTRDDLPDGGANHFAETIKALRHRVPDVGIEVLTPDFQWKKELLYQVLEAEPTVFNHNVETVRRMTPELRNRATYDGSLKVLKMASEFPDRKFLVKSGIMVGVGETEAEVEETIGDLYDNGVELLTIGQYLPPSANHYPVQKYVKPKQFEAWKNLALRIGFKGVASGSLVRSSYMAEALSDEKAIK